MTNTISRRTLAKGAAWSVPVVAVAAAAPAASASPADCITSGTLTNSASGIPANPNYKCVQTDIDGNPTGTDLGKWKVQIQVTTCTSVHAGATLKSPPSITANVNTGATAANVLRGFGATQVVQTYTDPDTNVTSQTGSDADYSVAGNVANPGTRSGHLNIANFAVPSSGAIITTATGSGAVETSTTPGSINIAATNFTVTLAWTGNDPDSGNPNAGVNFVSCTPGHWSNGSGGTGATWIADTNVPLTPAITVQ